MRQHGEWRRPHPRSAVQVRPPPQDPHDERRAVHVTAERVWRVVVLAAWLASACGRLGFDATDDADQPGGRSEAIYVYNDRDPSKTVAIAPTAPLAAAGATQPTTTA